MKTLKKISFWFALGLSLIACHSNDDEVGNWKITESFGGVGRVGAVSFVLGDRAYIGTGVSEQARELNDFYSCVANSDRELKWASAPTFPGRPRLGAVAFSTGKKAYVGLGYAAGYNTNAMGQEEFFDDFYRFDGTTWEKLPTPFPGQTRRYALGFYVPDPNNADKGKAYVAYGFYNNGNEGQGALKDWWEFDVETETWRELGPFGDKRQGACVAVIGSKAYIFTGQDGSSYPNDVICFSPYATSESEQFVKLDQLKNKDGQSFDNDYGMIPRGFAVAFAVGRESDQSARIYLASGTRGSLLSDCWEFNPYKGEKGRWDEVTSLPSFALRQAACAFVLNDVGYITVGGSVSVPSSSTLSVKQTSYLFEPGIDDDDQDDD
ncbi:Kelch repeat-containing protein [Odoribacter lunatus]|uniref:Kelch repeat-containing protein n=1 Tax=Odoribacter lunatus TaxID=2941335 RepID=UPI002042124E|nr:kelch repeat-containing protein [Odoribacter lunatus]